MGLSLYQKKRNFQKTPEPKGKEKKRKGPLRFLVHKHSASHEHYDLRLEMDGVYKSWAVPKEPSLNPSLQRLAVFVEDHPIEYGEFEGIIPPGNYGAGTVMIWDEGTYEERIHNGKDSEKHLLDGLKKGKMTFILHGKKLRGEFALVRMKGSRNWLLIKKRDNYSVTGVTPLPEISVRTGRTMAEIAQKEDKVWKRETVQKKVAVPHRIRPMAPLHLAKLPDGEYLFDPFHGGLRLIAEKEKGTVKLYSKNFLSVEKDHKTVTLALKKIKEDFVFDGEVKDGKYHIFDVLYLGGKDFRNLPLEERKKALKAVSLTGVLVKEPGRTDPNFKTQDKWIAKSRESLYRSGPSRFWILMSKQLEIHPSQEKPQLTHPDKVFWPEEGITKKDLWDYYESISDYILPYLVDRPESMHRQPDGIQNEGFFHKDITSFIPRRIKTLRVSSGSSGKTIHYLLCNDKFSLLYMVNLGCIELNPWFSRKDSLESPDFSVVDLDPDTNSFDEVIELAKEVEKILKKRKIESFVKTSGASGLHIVIPLKEGLFEETQRTFALSRGG